MSDRKSNEIKLKRKKVIELLNKSSETWDNELYCAYDFQLDSIVRDSNGYVPRGLGKEPYEYIEL